MIKLWQAWFNFLVLRNKWFSFQIFWKCKYNFLIFWDICICRVIIAIQKTVLHACKLAAAFVLFSLSSLSGHHLSTDAWRYGAVKPRRSPDAVVFCMHCYRQQQRWNGHLSPSPINTNKDDEMRTLMSDDIAYCGNYVRTNQGRPQTCRRSGQLNNLASRKAHNLAFLQTDIL